MSVTVAKGTALISVIVPVYNEEAGIDYLASRLATVRQQWPGRPVEFIFVDDGSADRTTQELKRVFGNDPTCKIACHPNNLGVGAAFRTGFGMASGSILCTIDADCSYGPENLSLLVNALEHQGADIAVASPYHPLGGVEGVPRWRLLLSRGCSLLYRLISPLKLYTYTSVFRAYRRAVVDAVSFEENGFVSAPEVLILAAKQGFSIVEVPMVLHSREIGHSKMRVLKTIGQHLAMMMRRSRPKSSVGANMSKSSESVPDISSRTAE